MADAVNISVKFNCDEALKSLQKFNEASRKAPAEIVNRFVFSMAIRAKKILPKVTTAQIQQDLSAVKATVLVKNKNGKFSKAKKNVANFFASAKLAKIINSRAAPDYAGPWKRKSSPFKGLSRQAGGEAMLDAMRAIFAARMKSSGYLVLQADIMRIIFGRPKKEYAPPPTVTDSAPSNTGNVSKRIGIIGDGELAKSGFSPIAKFWMRAPETSDKSQQRYGAIVEKFWQTAMDQEAVFTMEAAEKAFEKAAKQCDIIVNRS